VSDIQTSTVTGQGKDLHSAYADACGKILANAAQNGLVVANMCCTGFKELHPFKPAQRTTKSNTALKGQKKWLTTYAAYIMNETTGLWMKAKLPDDTDVSMKANVQQAAKDLCLTYQCQTCVRVERVLANDPNNQIEETYSPVSIKLGTWNFVIQYTAGSPSQPETAGVSAAS